jgi:hypothetical protein
MCNRSLLVRAGLTAILSLTCWHVHAQVITGNIFGTVKDSSDAVVPGATVTVVNHDTGVSRTLVTDESGAYSAPQLAIGRYDISATLSGFKTATTSGVRLSAGADVRVDLSLEVGAASESVKVIAHTAQLQTSSATVSNTITQQQIESLPTAGRDPLRLALLAPTVVQRGTANVAAVSSPYLGTNVPTIAGGRGEAVSFTVGGLNINNRVYNTPMEKPPLDSMAEFTILTNNYSAEYGQGDGQVIVELRSGANDWHGSAYDYIRNTSLNARGFLKDEKDTVHFNQFGATLGGPVRLPGYDGRDRSFFFFSYEGTRSPNSTIVSGLYPTAAQLNGDFSGLRNADGSLVTIYDPATTDPVTGARQPFPGNIIPANRISAIAKQFFAVAGAPTPTAFALPTNIQGGAANDLTVNQYAVKFDHAWGKDNFSTRYSFSDPYVISGSLVGAAENTQSLRNQLIGQTWTHAFGSSLLNELRAGYTRQRDQNVPPVAASEDLQQAVGITNPISYNLLPVLLLQSATGTPSFANLPGILAGGTGQLQQQFQFIDNVSWVRGRHSLKFGADIRRRHWDTIGATPAGAATLQFNGAFTSQLQFNPTDPQAFVGGFAPVFGTGSPIADLMLGQIVSEDYGLGSSDFAYRDTVVSLFGQDSWRLTDKLTVSLGLRWDYQSPVGEINGRQSWLVTDGCPTAGGCLVTDGVATGFPADPIVNPYPGQKKIRTGGITPDRNNFGPRVSVAYLLARSTVIRAGGGVFYSLAEQYQLPGLVTQPPFGTGYQIRATSTVVGASDYQLADAWTPLSGSSGEPVAPGVVSLNQVPLIENVTPRLVNATFAVEHTFGGNLSAEIGYAGKWGRHLPNFNQVNVCDVPLGQPCQNDPVSGQPIRVYSNFGPIFAQTTDAESDYKSFYARVDRRVTRGLAFGANYTWSQAFSTGFDSVANDIFQGGTYIQGLIDPRLLQRKRSLLDVPHRFVAYGSYELPFGSGQRFGSDVSRGMDALIGGWQVAWVTTFQSGMTLDLSSFGVAHFAPGGEAALKQLDFRKTGYFFDPKLFTFNSSDPLVPPNSFRGAGINNWDISASKKVALGGARRLEIRADLFNAFNHAQFEMPQNRIFAAGFGQFLLQLSDNKGNSIRPPRNIELSARFTF